MAGAYARLTGKLGVCIASNGPGVANVLPGLPVENAEGNRVLADHELRAARGSSILTAAAPTSDFNQVAVIKPMAKWSDSGRLVRSRRRAHAHAPFATAIEGDPVWSISTCPRTS